MAQDGLIETAPDDLAVQNEYGANRHFIRGGSLAGQIKRSPHEALINRIQGPGRLSR
jgi:hypothetical protein